MPDNINNRPVANTMVPIAPAPPQPSSQQSPSPQASLEKPTEISRTKRTRAKRSCDLCRRKKTRCDSSVNFPCTKCKLAKTECRFLTEQKKRGPAPRSYVGILEDRLQRMEKLLEKVSKKNLADGTEQQLPQQQSSTSSLPFSAKNEQSASEDERFVPSTWNQPSPQDDDDGDDNAEFGGRVTSSSRHQRCSTRTTPTFKDVNDDDYEASSPNAPCLIFEKGVQEEGEAVKRNSVDLMDSSYASMERQLKSLTINDYQRTRYIGSSSGVHLIDEKFMISNRKHRLEEDTSWFVQKLNKEKEEHVIMKTQEVDAVVPKEKLDERPELSYFKDVPYITQQFVDHTVEMFFTYNQKFCPFLNRVQFLEQYYYHTPCPPDKYLLYAIIYVSVTVFKDNVQKAKVLDLMPDQWAEIQSIMKEKAYHLLGIVHKRSMISTVQALMILSMFASFNCSDDEETSHWFLTGMAIRTAQDLGLHRDCSKWYIPEYEKELRRRIWYNAYMMDRWVAAELGRPLTILDHEFDVTLPSPYELDYQPIVDFSENTTPKLILEAQEALREKRPVYIAFTHLVTLTQIFGEVLHTFYLTDKAKENRYRNIELLNLYDKKLAQWKSSLPDELQSDVAKLHKCNRHDRSHIFAEIVNMIYGSILLLLFRPYIRKQDENSTPVSSELACRSLSICTAAAVNILIIAESVEVEALVVLPWKISIYALFQAAVIFLHNTKGANDVIKEQGREYLMRCSKVYSGHAYLSQAKSLRVLQYLIENFDVCMNDAPMSEEDDKGKDTRSSTLSTKRESSSRQQRIGYRDTSDPFTEPGATASTFSSSTSRQSMNTSPSYGNEQGVSLQSSDQDHAMLNGSSWPGSNAINSALGNMSGNMFPTAAPTDNIGLMDFSLDQQGVIQSPLHLANPLQSNDSGMADNGWPNGEPYNNTVTSGPTTTASANTQPPAPAPPMPTSYPSTSSTSTINYEMNNPFMLNTNNATAIDTTMTGPFLNNLTQCNHDTINMNIPHYHQQSFNNVNSSSAPQQQQQQTHQPIQLDSTCLASQVPLWDLPSGGTWHDWETFIRNNQSLQQQPPPPQ